MPRCYCFLCASDEGVFLEVAPEGDRAVFGDQIEACLSKKVNQTIKLSNKICYKCAYELEQCSKFLQRSQKSQEVSKSPKARTSVPHCSLCCEPVESGHIFDITEDNRSVLSPLQKIRKIFNEDLYKKVTRSKLVCLVCRYNLDVLYDLKKLHTQTISNLEALIKKELDYSIFPKVYTDVVNRKTTITTFPDTTIVYELINSDSDDSNEMARAKLSGKAKRGRRKSSVKNRNITKSQSDVKLKSRNCDQCSNVVANGMDMYRLHQTGQTVCRSCWITTDPSKNKSKRDSSYNSSAETKLCTVYLKDVLNEGTHNDDSMQKVEDNKDDVEIEIVPEQNSHDEENKDRKIPLRRKNKSTVNGNTSQYKKRQNSTKSDVETMPLKRRKVSATVHRTKSAKALSDTDQPSTSFQKQQGRGKRKIMSECSSDSEQSKEISVLRNLRKTRRSVRQASHSPVNILLTSEEDSESKKSKKRKTDTSKLTKSRRSESNDESNESCEIDDSRHLKKKVSISVMSTRSRTRSSSISSKEMTPPAEFKSPMIVAPQEYTCDKCSKKFNTKLAQAEHKLTHDKQFKLRLERVSIPSVLSEEKEEELKVDSQEDKAVPEEAETSVSEITFVENKSTDVSNLSEEIVIHVEDDIDDDISPQQSHKNDSGDDDQQEQPNVKKNKLHQEEENESSHIQVDKEASESSHIQADKEANESSHIQVDKEASESQQCEDSTVVLNETAAKMDDENEDTILINEADTSEKQDDHAREDNVVVAENHKDHEKEGEDATMKDDTEKTSAVESETKCDKDIDDEITFDNKTNKSPILSTVEDKDNTVEHDENYDESFESNLENHKDENKKTKDTEAKLPVDLMNDSQEEDPKKSEEKKFTPDINEMETLDEDKKNSMMEHPEKQQKEVETLDEDKEDSMMEHSEKQQNSIDKQNAEIEEVADDKNDDSTDSTTKPNLLNCEILDELNAEEKEEEEKNNVTDSNDIAAVKPNKVTEETITTNDSLAEEITPTKGVDDLEQLTENKECELQEKNKGRKMYEDAHNISTETATEIMEEVFDLAAAEVQKRRNSNGLKMNTNEDFEMETLENISREIRNTAQISDLVADDAMATNEVDTLTVSD